MKLPCAISTLLLVLLTESVKAFTASAPKVSPLSTQLNLFGGGKTADGENKPAGMMEQMAMMKKAQEIAQKKRSLDEELSKMEFIGETEGVKIDIKFSPSNNPMDPNPSYTASAVSFDDAFFESATPDELAAAVKEAMRVGIETTNQAVSEKYQSLSQGLMETFQQMKGQ